MDCIKLKKGRKMGFICRSDHTLALAAGHLVCELPLPWISSSWTGDSSSVRGKGFLLSRQTSAGRSKSTGPANQGDWQVCISTANTSSSWKHLSVKGGFLSSALRCQKMRCIVHVSRLGSLYSQWREGFIFFPDPIQHHPEGYMDGYKYSCAGCRGKSILPAFLHTRIWIYHRLQWE